MFTKRPQVNPGRIPIDRKQSLRWLEDVNRATGLFGERAHCVHVNDR
jgi:hypothetical protein